MFVQIIEYETERADELRATMESSIAEFEAAGERPPGTVTVTQDRDNPKRYMVIVEFPSYEEAMANSQRPETGEMAKALSELCSKGPMYHNLDVVMTRS